VPRLRNRSFALLIIAIMVGGLVFTSNLYFAEAQNGTNENGLINLDTAWTQAKSPYNLLGPVDVINGVTLTIEPGVIVNFNDNYIQVDGVLEAIGSSDQQIYLNRGKIIFTSLSDKDNIESIIAHCVLNVYLEVTASPEIISNIITATVSVKGSCEILNNTIRNDILVLEGSPIISNNVILNGQIKTYLGKAAGYLPEISNNSITGGGIACYGANGYGGYANISGNTLSSCQTAILAGDGTVERNYVWGNNVGIEIGNGVIENNTIIDNLIGINIPKEQVYSSGFGELKKNPVILNNNIYGNTNFSIYSTVSNNVNATYNWWGTTDQQAISQTIYDNKNDFTLGTVNFVPFLAAPNLQAPSLNVPTPTPNPSISPSPSVQEYPAITIVIVLITILIAIFAIKEKENRQLNP